MAGDHTSVAAGPAAGDAMPLISAVIPVFNAEKTLAATLSSLCSQTYERWEAVVVNDGSTDGSLGLAQDWASRDRRVRVMDQPNRGAGAARNAGLRATRGDLIHCLDADDRVSPTFYAGVIGALRETRSGGRCAYTGFQTVGEDGTVHAAFDVCPPERFSFCSLARDNNVAPPAIFVFEKTILERTGLFDEGLPNCQDWDLWLRFARTGVTFVPVPGLHMSYRVGRSGLSRNYVSSLECGKRVLERSTRSDARCRASDVTEAPLSEAVSEMGLARFWHNTLRRAASVSAFDAVESVFVWGKGNLPAGFWGDPGRFGLQLGFKWIEAGPQGSGLDRHMATIDMRIAYLACVTAQWGGPMPVQALCAELNRCRKDLFGRYPLRRWRQKIRLASRLSAVYASALGDSET